MTVILATMLTTIVMGAARGRQLPGEVMPVVRRPSKPLQPNKKRNWLSQPFCVVHNPPGVASLLPRIAPTSSFPPGLIFNNAVRYTILIAWLHLTIGCHAPQW